MINDYTNKKADLFSNYYSYWNAVDVTITLFFIL